MLLDTEEICYQVFPIIQQHVDKYCSKYSKTTYTQQQSDILNLLRLWWDCEYRELYKQIRNRSGIREMIGLESTSHWTCINKTCKKHSTLLYRQLNQRIQERLTTGTIAAIDSSGFQCEGMAQYYTKRTNEASKVELLNFITIKSNSGEVKGEEVSLIITQKDSELRSSGPELCFRYGPF